MGLYNADVLRGAYPARLHHLLTICAFRTTAPEEVPIQLMGEVAQQDLQKHMLHLLDLHRSPILVQLDLVLQT